MRNPINPFYTTSCILPSQNTNRIAEENIAEPTNIGHHHAAWKKMQNPLMTKAMAAKTNRALARDRVVESPRKLDKIHDLPVQPSLV